MILDVTTSSTDVEMYLAFIYIVFVMSLSFFNGWLIAVILHRWWGRHEKA